MVDVEEEEEEEEEARKGRSAFENNRKGEFLTTRREDMSLAKIASFSCSITCTCKTADAELPNFSHPNPSCRMLAMIVSAVIFSELKRTRALALKSETLYVETAEVSRNLVSTLAAHAAQSIPVTEQKSSSSIEASEAVADVGAISP